MKIHGKLILPAAVVILLPTAASAGERVTDAAIGAVAGAVVAGPVGFVGGGLIGYVAGPQIACDLGVDRCYRYYYRRHRHYGHYSGDYSGRREDHGNY